MTALAEPAPLYDPAAPLTASGNLRRRRVVSGAAVILAVLAAVLAVGVLGIVVGGVIARGASTISWHFFTEAPPLFGGAGGGIAPMIVGSALIVGAATLIAMPLGVLVAVFLTEFAGSRITAPIRLALDLMNGLPSIVVALFVFGLLVAGRHMSGFAGAIGLAIIMLPLIARATQEMLLLVPKQMRDAADALGVSRWRTVLGVVLPSAAGGILTGTVLAVARAAGETAPMLILCSIFNQSKVSFDLFGQAIPNIPTLIFTASEAADPAGFTRAWGAALVLLTFILLANIGARTLLARSRRKLTG
jgi:phosphate transport system permease protein